MSIHKSLSAVLAASALAIMASSTAVPAFAADKGLYVELRAGAAIPEDAQLDTATSQDAELDTGWVAGIGFGYAYGNGLRGEISVDYRENDADKVAGASVSGDVAAASLMISGYYDFFHNNRVQPYVGAGIGGAFVDADGITPISGSSISDDDIGFAFQGMAGESDIVITDRAA